jgi:aminobenzoyl-glutamate utilization protein B
MSKESLISKVQSVSQDLTDITLEMWRNPETALEEFKSSKLLSDYMKSQGFEIKSIPNNPTSFIAEFGSGKPILGILGEYDALPKLSQKVSAVREAADGKTLDDPGHGCGHNLLGCGGAGAAIAIKEAIEKGEVKGTIRFYGCAAEETLAGKGMMAREGVFDDCDACITWHPAFMNSLWGCSFLAMNSLKFRFKGLAAHAAAAPDAGRSALDAVELMDVGANYLREHVNEKVRIHYAITNGGGLPNTVPPDAEVWYYVRAPKRADVKATTARLIKIANGAAEMTETTMSYELLAGCYDVVSNHKIGDVMLENMRFVGGPGYDDADYAFAAELQKNLTPESKAATIKSYYAPEEIADMVLAEGVYDNNDYGQIMAGSTDVGDVSYICPTAQMIGATLPVGIGTHTWMATACTGSPIGVKSMIFMAKSLACTAYDLMTKPELLDAAKAEFKKSVGDFKYVSAWDEKE